MNRAPFFSTLAAACLLAACSPKVSTTVMKTYPPLNESDTVAFYHYGMDAPDSAEVIAEIAVKDAGMTTKCNYSYVIAIAKDETRKVGGDGFQVLNHLLPSILGGKCHEIEGVALRLNSADSLEIGQNERILLGDYMQKDASNIEPLFESTPYEVASSMGYSNIINRTKSAYLELGRLEKEISQNFNWDFQFSRYYNNGIGWGVTYSAYSAAILYKDINHSLLTRYIAPLFVARAEFGRWVLKCKVGVGYYKATDKTTSHRGNLRFSRSMLGANVNIGIDYKFPDNVALGLEVGAVRGSFTNKKDSEGVTYGDRRLDIKIGLRFYFGKKK